MGRSTTIAFALGVFTAVWLYALAMLALAASVSSHALTASLWSMLLAFGVSSIIAAGVAAAFWLIGLRVFKTAPSRRAAFVVGLLAAVVILVIGQWLTSKFSHGPVVRYALQVAITAVVGFFAAGVGGRRG